MGQYRISAGRRQRPGWILGALLRLVVQALPAYCGFPATTMRGVTIPREAAHNARRLITETLDLRLRPAGYALMLGREAPLV